MTHEFKFYWISLALRIQDFFKFFWSAADVKLLLVIQGSSNVHYCLYQWTILQPGPKF